LDPLGKGYYIGYSQRIAEKGLVQQDYLRHKFELNNETLRNSRQRAILSSSIGELQVSNSRLAGILQEQGLEQRLQDEEYLEFRRRRHLY
jgi:hypothetical protein